MAQYRFSYAVPSVPAQTVAFVVWSPSKVATVTLIGNVQPALYRVTARGTPTTTVAIPQDASAANPSNPNPTLVIDTAWSVNPTLAVNALIFPVAATPFLLDYAAARTLVVPAGSGLAVFVGIGPVNTVFSWEWSE